MVTDTQVRRLMSLIPKEKTLAVAAAKAGMDEKTARRYRRSGRLPSEMKAEHTWRTRPDPFTDVWPEVRSHLVVNPGLEAKTLFIHLQRKYPGRFQDGQLRTLQRRIKAWRALEGPAREVFFPQVHEPGALGQSDFTEMKSLGVTICGQPFDHLVYHFVLTYSNWESATICFSESFEALSEGLQNALWELGGVPQTHQTDCLSAAVHKLQHPDEFTQRYAALLRHYGLKGRKSQPASPHENGDVEQRHFRFRQAVDQALMMRGHRDFESRVAYAAFLSQIQCQLNAGRMTRLADELAVLGSLPHQRLDASKRLRVRVGSSSTIRVVGRTYSVHSRLIGESVDIRLHAEHLDVYYAQRRVEQLPRLRGKKRHRIQYQHVLAWLIRKPGAFENYRYRADLYPTSRFRRACDLLEQQHAPRKAHVLYLRLLVLAAREGEERVDRALDLFLRADTPIHPETIESSLASSEAQSTPPTVDVDQVQLACYDRLLETTSAARLQEAAG